MPTPELFCPGSTPLLQQPHLPRQLHRFYILTRPTGEWPTSNMKRREGYFPDLPPMELGSEIDAFVTRYFPGETVQDYGRCWGQHQDRCSIAIDYSPNRLCDHATH